MVSYHEGNPLISVAYHKSVLLREILDFLYIQTDAWYLDCTLGDGGHALEILKKGGNVLGIDVDRKALERSRNRFEQAGVEINRYKLIQGNFRDLKNLIDTQKFKACLFDLGVSSLQLEDSKRGFSFLKEGPLDMRMDPTLSLKAADLINALNKGELYELFTKLGEEKFAKRIVDALVSSRKIVKREEGIKTTKQLADLVAKVYREAGVKRLSVHPATKVFQALRIAVNDELASLKEALPQALEVLEQNGKIIVISFHSLEDRIVKNTFKEWQNIGLGQILTKKPIVPSDNEVKNNPRARSAKLRVFQVKESYVSC